MNKKVLMLLVACLLVVGFATARSVISDTSSSFTENISVSGSYVGNATFDIGTYFFTIRNGASEFVVDGSTGQIGLGAVPEDDIGLLLDTPARSITANTDYDRAHIRNSGAVTVTPGSVSSYITTLSLEEPKIVEAGSGNVTNAATLRIVDAPTEGDNNYALWVDNGAAVFDGSVGIKTSSPSEDLHVVGDIAIGGASTYATIIGSSADGRDLKINPADAAGTVAIQLFRDTDYTLGSGPYLYINKGDGTFSPWTTFDAANQRLGLGTQTPDTLLELVNNDPILTVRDSTTSANLAVPTLRLAESGAADSLGGYWDVAAGNGSVFNFNLQYNDAELFTVDTTGKVGIGTASPSATLDVVGNTELNGMVSYGTETELTINAGNITITKSFHSVDTESDAASDSLSCVLGGNNGDVIYLKQVTDSRDVTYKHNDCASASDRLWIKGAADIAATRELAGVHCIKQSFGWMCDQMGG